MKRLLTLRALFAGAALTASLACAANTDTPLDRPEMRAFINEMASKHAFDKEDLRRLFSRVELLPGVIEKITRPAEGLPWYKYQNIFLKETRIHQGVEFWDANADVLAKAEREYGVPAQIIVAILGVETRYGRHKGGYRIMDSLTTLALDYPKRASFFRSELEQFLLLAREEGLDPLSLSGSYAGAMGKPQFISSSYRRYAVDFDGDGKRDLLDNTADAVGSVANYFKRHGWQRGEPVAYSVRVSGRKYKSLVDKGLKPQMRVGRFADYGVNIPVSLPASTSGALIELESQSGHEYWVGLQNFYTITRYNHSPLYAMAVYQLSEEIAKRRGSEKVAITD